MHVVFETLIVRLDSKDLIIVRVQRDQCPECPMEIAIKLYQADVWTTIESRIRAVVFGNSRNGGSLYDLRVVFLTKHADREVWAIVILSAHGTKELRGSPAITKEKGLRHAILRESVTKIRVLI